MNKIAALLGIVLGLTAGITLATAGTKKPTYIASYIAQ